MYHQSQEQCKLRIIKQEGEQEKNTQPGHITARRHDMRHGGGEVILSGEALGTPWAVAKKEDWTWGRGKSFRHIQKRFRPKSHVPVWSLCL